MGSTCYELRSSILAAPRGRREFRVPFRDGSSVAQSVSSGYKSKTYPEPRATCEGVASAGVAGDAKPQASGRQRPLRNAGKYELLDFGGRIFEPAVRVGAGVAEAPCGETPGKTQKASKPGGAAGTAALRQSLHSGRKYCSIATSPGEDASFQIRQSHRRSIVCCRPLAWGFASPATPALATPSQVARGSHPFSV